MFKDEFPKELASLKAAPLKKSRARAERDPETTLTSGRSVDRSLDLLEELSGAVDEGWKTDEFASLPGPTRNNLLNAVRRLHTRVTEYASGQTGPQELDNEIDSLHVLLWQNNILGRVSSEELFERKNQQLERLKDKGRRINRELKQGAALRDQLKAALTVVDEQKSKATEAAEATSKLLAQVTSAKQESAQSQAAAGTSNTEAKRLETETAEVLKRAKASENEVGALTEKVKLFFGEIETERETLKELHSNTDERVSELEGRSKTIVSRHEDLQVSIDEQLQKATGATLFHAFQTRRKQITAAKWIWAVISVLSLMLTVAWSIFLAQSAVSLDTVFFVRLAGTIPVLALVVFCLSQYGRERRAEEDYAFKSALSLSLVPYRDLVDGLEAAGADTEHAKFLVKTIGQIYEAPRLAREASAKGSDKSVLKTVELVSDLVEKLVNR